MKEDYNSVWDDFSKYYDWEFDLICRNQAKDVSLWMDLAEEFGDPILELCCGSGRITLPLAKNGHSITAVDISEKMLKILRTKAEAMENIELIEANMTSFNLDRAFRFAFIGYTSFQLLLTLDDQITCLSNIREHLEAGGIVGLDICPTICRDKDSDGKVHSYTAYYPPDQAVVSMYSSWRIDKVSKIIHWTDTYESIDGSGSKKTYENRLSLKQIGPDQIELLLRYCGFRVMRLYGSLEKGPATEGSEVLIYIAQKT